LIKEFFECVVARIEIDYCEEKDKKSEAGDGDSDNCAGGEDMGFGWG